MKETDLKHFARQLSVWAELVIEHGRTPFRRVDLFPRINTRLGRLQPPLVFWINRQSLMAGGVILLPDNNLPQQLDVGCATAAALGLRHFVTWERDRIRIWNSTETPPREEQQFPVVRSEDPEIFRALLLQVMEQLKLLSVLGMVPTAELSASYLHNLFQETLDSALGSLVTTFRQTRAEGGLLETTRADRQAEQRNRLTLLRLLALLWHDRLPESILPEKLEWAMELALPSLPAELYQPLAFPQKNREPALPIDSAVCYHHLQLRLRQIRWNDPPERAIRAINHLLQAPDEVAEASLAAAGPSGPLLQINPATPLLNHAELHELSDSPSFLAAAALLRSINGLPPARQYSGNLFTLSAPSLPAARVQGKLVNRRKVPRQERQRCDALLRTSWPTRRFKFPPDTPCWVLETVHLLGLSPAKAQLTLEIPLSWLSEPFGQTLWQLIRESFRLLTVSLGEGTTVLQLARQQPVAGLTTVRSAAEDRQLDWDERHGANRSLLLLSLLLTPEQYRLLISDRLQPCSEVSAAAITEAGLLNYSRSSLGRCFWKILGGNRMPRTTTELRRKGTDLGWPIPEENVLDQLGFPDPGGTGKTPSSKRLDRQLSDLLGSAVPTDISCPQLPRLPETFPAAPETAVCSQREEILRHLDAFGVPDFPAQYLYQLEKPQLTAYRFQPPLQVLSELLGEFELIDADQKHFSLRGAATVEALKLCAELGRSDVELPQDQQQLDDILTSYRNDVRRLRRELTRQTHTRLESPQAAERLAKKLWKELALPSWKWLDH